MADSDADPTTVGQTPAPFSASARTEGGWTVRATLRAAEDPPLSHRLGGPLTAALLVSLLAAFLVAAAVGRLVASPLEGLLARVMAVARGERPRRLVRSRIQEILELTRAVDAVAEEVRRGVTHAEEVRERIDAVLRSMTEGVVVVDTEARVRLVNEALRRLAGVAGEVEGRPLIEVVRSAALDQATRETLEGKEPTVSEITLPRRPPRTVVATTAPLLDAEGGVHGAVLVLRDVTERRRVQAMREDFVANVSHELKTPIAAIRGFAETLLDGALSDPEAALDFVRTICDHAQRMQALVDDLLDLAALDAGANEPEPERLSVREAVDMALEQVRAAAERRDIHLVRHLPEGVPDLFADPAWVLQILTNLLDNAIKYSPSGETVRVEAKGVPEGVELRVVDHGPGIPEEARERIFERFYRVDPGRSREMGGTGLGLSIVRHLVERSGGSIQVHCPPEGGSVFAVTLPAAEVPIAEATPGG